MRIRNLILPLALAPLLLSAASGPGAILGRAANADGAVQVTATSLDSGARFSATADDAGQFTLASLPPGAYRVVMHNQAGTSVARQLVTVRPGVTLRLDARLDQVLVSGPTGARARRKAAAGPVAAATAPDQPPIVTQFQESSRYLNAITLVDDNNGWAVGDPHWDQTTHQIKGTIVKTADGGLTWSNQDPGGTDTLNTVFFLNATQGWAAGDNGAMLRTVDGGAHWTRSAVDTGDSFASVFFTDASNGWATSNTPLQYAYSTGDFTDWQASIWHSIDGGQTWSLQTVPASASLLKRVYFTGANTGFAAGMKRTGYESAARPQTLGAIYGTTDGGRTWNELFATSAAFTFTALAFSGASNGWASGFPHLSNYSGPCTFHTADGGKTWQPQSLNQDNVFFTQVRDLHMQDSQRGYAAGTSYLGTGPSVWRTLDGGATWTSVKMQNTNPLGAEGYWGLAVTANRVLTVGDRDATAYSTHPWDACAADFSNCSALFTQANISPHYIFHDVFFTDRNHGWAAGSRTFSPQLWGQEILATQDGGQTWTAQFERSAPEGQNSHLRLDSISFADTSNGWAAGSSESYPVGQYSALLGCILHTSDGGKTWTDQAGNLCQPAVSYEFSVIQALDAQNVWALSVPGRNGTVQLAHATDGGAHWAMVDTGIAGSVAVGFHDVQGAMRFRDAQHGCFAGWDVVGCTADGGAHWTQSAVDCGLPWCELNSNAIAFTDALHGWIGGGALYQTADGGAHWSVNPNIPKGSNRRYFEGTQFTSPSTGWLAGDYGVLLQSTDSGATWQSVTSGAGVNLLGLSFTDTQHGWLVGEFGTILSYAADRTPAGTPAVFSAINAASYSIQVAPNAWISIFGANLSATSRSWASGDFVANKLPTRLDGVSVAVNGNPAYLSYISPGQINAMFPDDGSTGPVTVQVTNSQGTSGTLAVQKATYSPALFRLGVEQGNYVIAQTTDNMLVGNSTIRYDLGSSSQVREARPGEIVTLYGTGFGPTNPPLASDTLVGAYAQLASPVTFRIGGAVAQVEWAGMIGSGLYQFNVQIPAVAGGDMTIVAEIAGYRTQGDSVISVSYY
jgi:uncharacterized protein (TIGR03437 family)